LSAAAALVSGAAAGVPLGSLVYLAGLEFDHHRVRHWSLRKLLSGIFTGGSSLLLGVLAATTAAALGLGLAWWLRSTPWRFQRSPQCPGGRWRRDRARWGLPIAVAAFAVPGPLVAVAIVQLMNRREVPPLVFLYDQTLAAPWLALLVRTLPWTTLFCWAALRTVPDELLDVAATDGAGRLASLWNVALPLRRGAVASAWLVAFLLSLGDVAFTVIVLPPGVETISVRIFRLIHARTDYDVAGVCLLLIVVLSLAGTLAALALGALHRAKNRPVR